MRLSKQILHQTLFHHYSLNYSSIEAPESNMNIKSKSILDALYQYKKAQCGYLQEAIV